MPRTFMLESPASIRWLRQLHATIWSLAHGCVIYGECETRKVLEELRHILRRLDLEWKGKERDDILKRQAPSPLVPWPKKPRGH